MIALSLGKAGGQAPQPLCDALQAQGLRARLKAPSHHSSCQSAIGSDTVRQIKSKDSTYPTGKASRLPAPASLSKSLVPSRDPEDHRDQVKQGGTPPVPCWVRRQERQFIRACSCPSGLVGPRGGVYWLLVTEGSIGSW